MPTLTDSTANSDLMARALTYRQALRIVHHVAGRIRLRVGPALYGRPSAVNGHGVQGLLRSLDWHHHGGAGLARPPLFEGRTSLTL